MTRSVSLSMMTRALAASFLSFAAASGAQAADLTVTAFGGSWEKAYQTCFIKPFEKETGKTVGVVLGNPAQWVNQVAANPSHPPIDVIVSTPEASYRASSLNLLVKLTPDNVPNLSELDPGLLAYGKGYGFPITFGDFGLMYNSKTVKNPPKSWQEFVDGTVAGKWQAALPGIAYVSTPPGVIALFNKVYGGSNDNIQPALDQVKRMQKSGHVTFYSDPNSPLMALRSGDVDIAMYYDGRAWAEHDANNPDIAFVSPAPGSVAFPNMAQLVKNSSPLGVKFINRLASADGQSCFVNAMQYAASNKNVKYDARVKTRIATKSGSIWINFEDIAQYTPQWIEQWNKQIGR